MFIKLTQIMGGNDESVDEIYYYDTVIDTNSIQSFSTVENFKDKTFDFIVNGKIVHRVCYGVYSSMESDIDDIDAERLDKIARYADCMAKAIIKILMANNSHKAH